MYEFDSRVYYHQDLDRALDENRVLILLLLSSLQQFFFFLSRRKANVSMEIILTNANFYIYVGL